MPPPTWTCGSPTSARSRGAIRPSMTRRTRARRCRRRARPSAASGSRPIPVRRRSPAAAAAGTVDGQAARPAWSRASSSIASLDLVAPTVAGEYLLLLDIVTPDDGSIVAAGVEPTIIRVTVKKPAADVAPAPVAAPAASPEPAASAAAQSTRPTPADRPARPRAASPGTPTLPCSAATSRRARRRLASRGAVVASTGTARSPAASARSSIERQQLGVLGRSRRRGSSRRRR